MPIYEYRCRRCGLKNTFLVLNLSQPPALICRQCGGTDLEKLVSRIAVLRSEEDRLEDLAESPDLGGVDENDPRSVARWMKKMGREMGEDLGPELDQSLDEAAQEGEAVSGAKDEGGPEPSEAD